MIELNTKEKEALALLYEYPEFKAFKRWSELHTLQCAEQVLHIAMDQPGASEKVAKLQGQALAHELALLELQKIHKNQTKEP